MTVTVIETWQLKEKYAERVLELMQEMEDIIGPGAHVDPGWCDHGRFYQLQESSNEAWKRYTWRSRDKRAQCCTGPRAITYFTELTVDVKAASPLERAQSDADA